MASDKYGLCLLSRGRELMHNKSEGISHNPDLSTVLIHNARVKELGESSAKII